jgi:hypothetical protein
MKRRNNWTIICYFFNFWLSKYMALIPVHLRHPTAWGRKIKIAIKGAQNKINNKMTIFSFCLLNYDLVKMKQNI